MIPYILSPPQTWSKHYNLKKSIKLWSYGYE